MRRKKPYVVTLDDVTISREGESAIIRYANEEVGEISLKIGPEIEVMTDAEILNAWNDCVRAEQKIAAEYVHVAVEVPPGKPQIEYSERCYQWVPRGGVIRCAIEDDENGETVVDIDDRKLSWEEFGGLIRTYAGWGMRIVFVPDDELEKTPRIEVREPKEDA